ncbi:MAG: hypothetical protein LAO31_22320 [Acidobacteriia bacterium]|nr:hypothetical protein [Terriglobia bacterium]
MPTDGVQATAQGFSRVAYVIPDGVGGFFFSDQSQNKIYHVAADGTLRLIAGSTFGFSGDGGPATLAQLANPYGVAVDAGGNLYIADSGNNRVRRVTPAGVISTVAGDGTRGFGGDGGPATSARLGSPIGVAVDAAGNLYIGDTINSRVRKVNPAGVISTVAGFGANGFTGDGGPATSAFLASPMGVAVDSDGNLYIADAGNHRVRKVTTAGVISTVAGTGWYGFSGDGGPATSAQLYYPYGVAADAAGNLYIADTSNSRIRKVTPAGVISTVAGDNRYGFVGDGPVATLRCLAGPYGVAVDAGGNLYIADTSNSRVRKVTPAGAISTAAGIGTFGFAGDGGPAASAQLNYPQGLALDVGGNLYIGDTLNSRVRKVTPAGVISTAAGIGTFGFSGDGGPATSAKLGSPYSLAVDAGGNLYIADSGNYRIRKVTPTGVISTVAGNGTRGFSGDGGPATSAQLGVANGVAVDAGGNLYIADLENYRVRKVTPAGVISTVAGNGTRGFSGDGGPATSAQLDLSYGLAVDAGGNLYIADSGNYRIRKVTPAGVISSFAGKGSQGFSGDGGPATSAQLYSPGGLAVDAGGNLFIAEVNNDRIREVTVAGVIITVAGNGTRGFSGDGGPATLAQLDTPYCLAIDAKGKLYISDEYNARIRKVSPGPKASIHLAVGSGGDATVATTGSTGSLQAGYAVVDLDSGNPSYGTAVFSMTQDGVVVTEVGVPASPPTLHGRIFIDFRTGVAAKSSENEVGAITIDTGMALVNRGNATAHLSFSLRDGTGSAVLGGSGSGTLAAGAHTALFIGQLNSLAAGFNLPSNFSTTTKFGSLDISSDQSLSILALRQTTNQRGEALLTSTPIVDMTQPTSTSPLYFPQFADGGGYTTMLTLMNTTNAVETGTLAFYLDNGTPVVVQQVGGSSGSTFSYSIPARGVFVFQTDGSPSSIHAGSVQAIPDEGMETPAGAGVFSLTQGGNLVTQSGIPSAIPTTHARIYVDTSGGHDTGLAIANPWASSMSVVLSALESDGVTPAGSSNGPIDLSANGHMAKFAGEFISGLPIGFTGVLDISSSQPFAALTLRLLTNTRGDTLLTTFPIADFNQSPVTPLVFPQIADGGGYQTEFILLNTNGGSSILTLNFSGDSGAPLAVGKTEHER